MELIAIVLAVIVLGVFLVLWLAFRILSWIPLGLLILFVILWLIFRGG